MTELRHYTSFEDLKNSEISAPPVVTNTSAQEREKQFIEFIELVKSSMKPFRPNQKFDGKQLR